MKNKSYTRRLNQTIGANNTALTDAGAAAHLATGARACGCGNTTDTTSHTRIASLIDVHMGEKVIFIPASHTAAGYTGSASHTVAQHTRTRSVTAAKNTFLLLFPVAIAANDRMLVMTGLAVIVAGGKNKYKGNKCCQQKKKRYCFFHSLLLRSHFTPESRRSPS